MVFLIILGVILLLLIGLLLLKVGVNATYDDKVLCVKAIAGPVKITVFPLEKEQKPKKEKKPKKKVEEKPEEEKPKSKIPILDLIKVIVPAAIEALKRLRRKIDIDILTVHYTVASDDPYSTATSFGYISAAVGVLTPLLDRAFDIKKQDIQTDVSFDTSEPVIFANVQLTIAIWEIIYIAIAFLPVIKAIIKLNKENRKVEENGQAADK
jgi:hypothetical protein